MVPRRIENDTPSTARTSPNVLTTSRTARMAVIELKVRRIVRVGSLRVSESTASEMLLSVLGRLEQHRVRKRPSHYVPHPINLLNRRGLFRDAPLHPSS